MAFDFWAAAAVADELRRTALPGRVQQVVQVDGASLALELYAGRERRYLLLSADQQTPRVHLLADKPRRGVDTASPLLQLLRKYVRGAALIALEQPPWERVLRLDFQHPEFGRTAIIAELIGRWSNLLLVRETSSPASPEPAESVYRILDCIHRRRPQDGVARPAMPGQLYQPPPAQTGLTPDALDAAAASRLLTAAQPETPLWRVLMEALQGVSPLAARELLLRAYGDAAIRAGQVGELGPLVDAMAEWIAMLQTGAWQPCLARDAQGAPLAFAPYPLTHLSHAHLTALASISAAVEQFYGEKAQSAGDSYAVARRQVEASLQRAQRGLEKRREAIQRQLLPAGEIERLRASGEWILALATQIRPRQVELTPPEGVELPPIRLDPTLSPAGNAAAYFKRYRKARRAAEMGQPRLDALAVELSYLEQLGADLALAADRNEIDAVRVALAEAGYARKRLARSAPPGDFAQTGQSKGEAGRVQVQGPRRFASVEGYTILVGRNSRQNEHITFDLAGPDDLWLHARGWPGSHVVIRSGGRPVSDETVAQAAGLAAFYSKAQREGWVDVIVTEKRQVRRPPGPRHPGMALVEGERVVRVRPASGTE
ncbi:MAG TPA: NFACT RNA binding domain-containing protein [Anaerolineae bacterium]|nr:NFACT RNA binding domain-containing protein [Anaerolineae bacterium]HNU05217.1 NFACT RNA binding domain-containing protein [Anaerolineae bacterium]